MLSFIEILTQKSRRMHRESQHFIANLQVEMSDVSVQLAYTMLNLFTCIEQRFVHLIYERDIGEFPIKAYFIKEM